MHREKVTLHGLRSVLRRFDEDGRRADGAHWAIGRGGYDLWWQLYYNGIPVVDCVAGRIQNNCMDDKDFRRVRRIIAEEYG